MTPPGGQCRRALSTDAYRGPVPAVTSAGPQSAAPAGSGTALAGSDRSRMESIVGGDLSGTMLHTDSAAADRATGAGALAVTVGRDVAFARGAYRPGTPAGDALLAHELAHVRQQHGGGAAGARSGGLEREADRAAVMAAVLLLDPALARSMPAPRVSTGQGLQLQRCAAPRYEEISSLPSRAEYEQRGELQPQDSGAEPAALTERLDLDPGTGMLVLAQPPAAPPARLPPLPEPDPAAPELSPEQLLARLAVLDSARDRIETLTEDVAGGNIRDESGVRLVPQLLIAFIRHDLGVTSGPTPLAVGTPAPPARDPAELSRLLPRTEEVQRRAYDALLELAEVREREAQLHGALVDKGYDLGGAQAEVDTVRIAYARAAADLFGADQARLYQRAETVRAGLDARLLAFLVRYFQQRATKGSDVAPAIGEMQDWAAVLGAELTRLTTVAEELRAAQDRGEDVTERQRQFAVDAQLVATSLDALGEWDTALSAYEVLEANTALWGQEAVLRVAERMGQMKNASLARDEPYLRLLVRDHRGDPVIKKFYASLADIIKESHLIIGFAVLLVAALVTAGVGMAISGVAAGAAAATETAALAGGATATAAAAEATVVLQIGLVAKIGGEAVVFTLVHQGLLAAIPGMGPKLTLSSFLTELVWNLALFGVLHGVGSVVEGALGRSAWLKALGPAARTALQTGARMGSTYATLQAYGLIRFMYEQRRGMTLAEFGTMSVQNLAMLAGLSIAMKPFSGALEGIRARAAGAGNAGAEALIRFRLRYGERYRALDSERTDLEGRLRERMRENPQATKDDLADIESQATDLDARLSRLVQDSIADPAVDVSALRTGLTEVTAQLETTPVPELLTGLGVEVTVDLRASGDPNTWTIAPGTADAVVATLAAKEIPVATGDVGGQRVVEATIAGRGTIDLVERTAPAEPAVPVATPVLDAMVAKDATAAAGLGAIRAQSAVPDLAARLEARAAAGDTRVVRLVLDAARRLATARRSKSAPAPGSDEALVAFEAARNHALALDAALADPAAEAGLRKLMGFGYRTGHGRVLAAAAPDDVAPFLRALADPGLGRAPAEFYEGLARSRPAISLAARYGGRVLLRVIHLQGADVPPELQVSRAWLDIDRVLTTLERTTLTGGDAVALADKIARLPSNATYKYLDSLVDPRPAAIPAFDAVKTVGARWQFHLNTAKDFAARHAATDGPMSDASIDVMARLLQTVERARGREFGDYTPAQRQQMLDQFNQLAYGARLNRGWINSTRGQLNQALALGAGPASLRTIWKDGKVELTQVPDSTVPDEAVPPVRPGDLIAGRDGVRPVERIPRMWIEDKSYELSSRGSTIAGDHAREATADLTNLPPGSTIALRYAKDPGLRVRTAMLAKFWAPEHPGIVQVIFEGTVYPRPATSPATPPSGRAAARAAGAPVPAAGAPVPAAGAAVPAAGAAAPAAVPAVGPPVPAAGAAAPAALPAVGPPAPAADTPAPAADTPVPAADTPVPPVGTPSGTP